MATVQNGTISLTPLGQFGGSYGPQVLTCGSCGAMVADQHVQVHIAWHSLAAATAFPSTVTARVPAGVS
jgi:hypothetical protein